MVSKKIKLIVKIFIIVGCSSCASWKANYDFCKETDWRELGMKDAKEDQKMEESFMNYQHMCREFDEELKPNLTLYRFGHHAAIKTLCTYDNGRKFGLNRKVTSNNCSSSKHPKFYQGIKDGVDEYCSFDSGIKRAMEGYRTSEVCSHKRKKHQAFYKGINKGLFDYCTYDYGKKIGFLEQEYRGVCRGSAEKRFLKGYNLGLDLVKIKKLKKSISELRQENAKLEEQIESESRDNIDLRVQRLDLLRQLKK